MESIQVGTADGVRLAGVHVTSAHPDDLAFVLCHGFTVSTARPAVRRIAARLARRGGVLAVDFRGHGRSAGRSTVGDREVLDVDAVVRLARRLGYDRVATVGFSMGGAVVVRHAAGAPTAAGVALAERVDAAVSVSAPSRWYIRDTRPMRRVHWLLESRTGRLVSTSVLRTRLGRWDPAPASPVEVAARIPPVPFLVVHGDRDEFLGVEHGRALAAAAGPGGAELWEVAGFGHAEGAATPALVDRIAGWVAGAALRAPSAGTMRP